MIGERAMIVGLAALPILSAILISRKLLEMLFTNKLYWLRREGNVDKVKQPFTHAFYVCVFAFCLVAMLGFIWLCVWTAMHI